ncbi:CHAT domain-containing protein OS=Streptomyces antimycoticus OX=68175 GN=SSPO_084130 PE=4 SV=1 [Streptomyces antimycoticus]
MEDERRRHDGGQKGARTLRAWAAIAARQARDVVTGAGDDPGRTVALAHAIEHVAAIERLLPADDPLPERFRPLAGRADGRPDPQP